MSFRNHQSHKSQKFFYFLMIFIPCLKCLEIGNLKNLKIGDIDISLTSCTSFRRVRFNFPDFSFLKFLEFLLFRLHDGFSISSSLVLHGQFVNILVGSALAIFRFVIRICNMLVVVIDLANADSTIVSINFGLHHFF